MLSFWVLSMSHIDGCTSQSVYTNITTLMQYWGHALADHNKVQCVSITQETVDTRTGENETVIEISVFNNDEQRYTNKYFNNVMAVAEWVKYHEENHVGLYRTGDMSVRSLYVCKD
jgi:hypothetical protein